MSKVLRPINESQKSFRQAVRLGRFERLANISSLDNDVTFQAKLGPSVVGSKVIIWFEESGEISVNISNTTVSRFSADFYLSDNFIIEQIVLAADKCLKKNIDPLSDKFSDVYELLFDIYEDKTHIAKRLVGNAFKNFDSDFQKAAKQILRDA